MKRLSVAYIIISCFLVRLAAPQRAAADDAPAVSPPSDTRCSIDVRSLKGMHPREANRNKELKAGAFMADLKDQLEALPFSRFEALSQERQQVPLHEQAIFRVTSAKKKVNTVFVEVECVSENGAQLKIDWNTPDGKNILSTQLRLKNGKNWVIGTDHEDKTSTIVSIKAECTEKELGGAETPEEERAEGHDDEQ